MPSIYSEVYLCRMQDTFVAIMAGGVGSRFWPKSREARPKQFLDILGTGKSLLRMTYERYARMVDPSKIYIVTHERYRDLCLEDIPGLKPEQIVAEPSRRNTAPCVALIAWKIAQKNNYANLIVAPADHLIIDETAFKARLLEGLEFVKTVDALVTLGIRPTRPDTGYGYIQYHESEEKGSLRKVKTFTEKPNIDLARNFLASGDFLWNSGMFIWNVRAIKSAFEKHLAEMADVFEEGVDKYNTDQEEAFIKEAYSQCKSISIDYGIMEKAENVYVIPSSFGWSDLGTWTSVWNQAERDKNGNVKQGEVMSYDCKNTFISAPKDKIVIVQGLEDYCVVDTEDALLICSLDQEQRIKEMRLDMKKDSGEKFL